MTAVKGRLSTLPLEIEIPADAQHLTEVRAEVASWLATVGAGAELAADITLVVVEGCANSIEHGYRNQGTGVVRVALRHEPSAVSVTISDQGQWKAESIPDRIRGRGMPLMRALSSQFDLSTGRTGTSVSMTFEMTPPVEMTLPVEMTPETRTA